MVELIKLIKHPTCLPCRNYKAIYLCEILGMLNEAIRGIFDGWQMLGRRFSVYYYFAKYVAKQASWRTAFTKYGVVYTAGRVIETFHRLGRHQQVRFI